MYSNTPVATYFFYDQSAPWGYSLSNPIGRVTTEGTQDTTTWSWLTAAAFSYDSMGRIVRNDQCTPTHCSWVLNYGYDLLGNTTSSTNGEGVTISQSFNLAGRLTSVTSSWVDSQHPATLLSVDSTNGYWPAGLVHKMAYGNALTSTMAFNNRFQPCRINVNSTAATLSQCTDATPSGNVQDFTSGFSFGSANNGSVMSMSATGTSSAQTFSKTYTYDQLNRLATMSGTGGACTGLSWSYDTWGNRTAQTPTGGTCNQSSLGFDANNHLNYPSGFTYDPDGNLTYDGVHHYYYDADSRLIQVDGTLG